MYNNKETNDTKSLSYLVAITAILFVGAMFICVTWNAIADVTGLPHFNYWTCLCAYGALEAICSALGEVFKGGKRC